MRYRLMSRSALKVSRVCLGTAFYGSLTPVDESVALVHRALDLGVNFIDTANTYGDHRFDYPGVARDRLMVETIVGQALKGRREGVILATKCGEPVGPEPGQRGLSRQHIMSQVEESLRRLQTEYIDLYYPHHPDPQTPVEETMRAFDDLIRAGKVRHIGLSDVAAWQAVEALWVAERKGLNLPVVLQVLFNMLYREPEEELLPVCDRFGLSLVAFSPLAGGVLSGIYRRGAAAPVGSRGSITSTTSGRPAATPVLTDENLAFVEKVAAFALAHGHTTAQVALAWLLAHEPVASVICGAGSVTELEESVRAADLVLSAEDMQQL